MRLGVHAVAIAVVAVGVSAPVEAQVPVATLEVRTEVVPQCALNVGEMNFGIYDPQAGSQASADIELICTPGAVLLVSLDGGGGGDVAQRRMSGPESLTYQLYRDPARNEVFGNTPSDWAQLLSDGHLQRVTVYGRVPPNQVAPQGSYVDVVRVSVAY